MRRPARTRWLALGAIGLLTAATGCAENAFVLKGQVDRMQQQQLALSRQAQELQSRAATLDRDNQELGALLAQSRQRVKLLEDQLSVTREQLTGVTSQLAQLREEKKTIEQKAQTLTASMQRQGSVTIQPNNSFLDSLPAVHLPNVSVRRDGDTIRIELPGQALFDDSTGQLRPGAAQTIGAVAAEIHRLYPDQLIGVEGHMDVDPLASGQWRIAQQVSLGRAAAVYDVLTAQSRLKPNQLFVVGHGANHPIVSNGDPRGRLRNRRIELVIYPEKANRSLAAGSAIAPRG